jgi:hypothetical protein
MRGSRDLILKSVTPYPESKLPRLHLGEACASQSMQFEVCWCGVIEVRSRVHRRDQIHGRMNGRGCRRLRGGPRDFLEPGQNITIDK